MKTVAKGAPGFNAKSAIGKEYQCPHCGSTNQVENAADAAPVTTNIGGIGGPEQLQHYQMGQCPTCNRTSTIAPYDLHHSMSTIMSMFGKAQK